MAQKRCFDVSFKLKAIDHECACHSLGLPYGHTNWSEFRPWRALRSVGGRGQVNKRRPHLNAGSAESRRKKNARASIRGNMVHILTVHTLYIQYSILTHWSLLYRYMYIHHTRMSLYMCVPFLCTRRMSFAYEMSSPNALAIYMENTCTLLMTATRTFTCTLYMYMYMYCTHTANPA